MSLTDLLFISKILFYFMHLLHVYSVSALWLFNYVILCILCFIPWIGQRIILFIYLLYIYYYY